MKWLTFIVLSFCSFSFVFSAEVAESSSGPGAERLDTSDALPFFYELWRDSGFGKDPNRTERAGWIIRNSKDDLEYMKWPTTAARSSETWEGTIPQHTIALAHTHPATKDPKPSAGDRLLAKHIRVAIYTISEKGIWKVTPDGIVAKEAGFDWYKSAKEYAKKE